MSLVQLSEAQLRVVSILAANTNCLVKSSKYFDFHEVVTVVRIHLDKNELQHKAYFKKPTFDFLLRNEVIVKITEPGFENCYKLNPEYKIVVRKEGGNANG